MQRASYLGNDALQKGLSVVHFDRFRLRERNSNPCRLKNYRRQVDVGKNAGQHFSYQRGSFENAVVFLPTVRQASHSETSRLSPLMRGSFGSYGFKRLQKWLGRHRLRINRRTGGEKAPETEPFLLGDCPHHIAHES